MYAAVMKTVTKTNEWSTCILITLSHVIKSYFIALTQSIVMG